MEFSELIAKHLREVHFGGNWTASNLKAQLDDISWQEATVKVNGFNSIATLAFHVNYYVRADLDVLKGKELNASDKLSFDNESIENEDDWEHLKARIWAEAEEFATCIEKLSDNDLKSNFVKAEHGNFYRNLHGIIEHIHYHLGQISLIKKLIREG